MPGLSCARTRRDKGKWATQGSRLTQGAASILPKNGDFAVLIQPLKAPVSDKKSCLREVLGGSPPPRYFLVGNESPATDWQRDSLFGIHPTGFRLIIDTHAGQFIHEES